MRFVDINGWPQDSATEGSRDKYAVVSPDTLDEPGLISGHRYLVKFSIKRHPVQFWSEVIAYCIGNSIGVNVPSVFVTADPQTDQPASLTEWFYGFDVKEKQGPISNNTETSSTEVVELTYSNSVPEYFPGSVYMVANIDGFDLTKGRQHNIQTLLKIVRNVSRRSDGDFLEHWQKTFVFDAIIGNTDRHQDNWGIIWRPTGIGISLPEFSPAFDNGTSLMYEIMPEKLCKFKDDVALDAYIRRGYHHIRATRDSPNPLGHFELIELLLDAGLGMREVLDSILGKNFDEIFQEIRGLSNISVNVPLTAERIDCIERLIRRRLDFLRTL